MLKTLREDGFEVTCYERRNQVGGLWAYTDDKSMTTALPSKYARPCEIVVVAKEIQVPQQTLASIPAACRTFQCQTVRAVNPQLQRALCSQKLEYPHYLSQAEFQEYIESYATHFDMHKDIVFNTVVKQVSRNKDDTKWRLDLVVDGESRVEEYDKVAFCHGYQTKANMPEFEGVEKFDGTIMHTQQFRM